MRVDELEERRVMRRLAAVADGIEPLSPAEVRGLLERATVGRSPGRRSRTPQLGVLLATAAAVLVGFAVSSGSPPSQRVSQDRGTATGMASFEGSALRLLLARDGSS